ncbi:exonuclease domain-containing protein [Flaviflexus massiliensis]|uniref:exonuclease domain-containing protein n=1 Tax=Flaviflexus massiliensis TaxID=1522309 RepID=UPI0006D52C47|nr:exonuclease domain-containing protein [Flaviflexus massiliensis]
MSTQTHWTAGPLVGFDTETTGVSPRHSRLVTASIIITGEESQTFDWLTDPGVEIPRAAQDVHGISTAQARSQGRPPAEVLIEIRDILVRHMGAGHPVVAFNASFDLTLMEFELARHGLSTMTELLGHEPAPVLDPLVLDRMLDPYRKGPRRLETLVGIYKIDAGGFHDAHNDVVATLRLLRAMINQHAMLKASSLRKLQELQKQSHEKWAVSFNKWLESRGRKPDVDASWPLASPQNSGD